jgi:multidrug efflux pump subunit AcrA (membrane-fusion protein)
MLMNVNLLASILYFDIFAKIGINEPVQFIMKKPLIITACVFAAFFILFLFNSIASKKPADDLFAEAVSGDFEITVTAAGELIPERSIDIKAPEMAAGMDFHSSRIEIKDLIPEGTIVRKGDYIATLDRTEYSNMLKDVNDRLTQMNNDLQMRILDTAVQLNGLRDQIKNQRYSVLERELTFQNSKFEPPTVIRQAEINVEQSKRILDQISRNYTRRLAQMNTDIYNMKYWISRIEKRKNDLENLLAGFTITAPGDGMVIYKRERRGNKRKAGSFIDPMDRVVATLPDLTSMLSKVYVSEIEISKVKPGLPVDISIDAFPKKMYRGNVSFVANIGEKLPNSNDKMFEVQVRLSDNDPALRPSMTTGNKITIKSIKNAVYVPIECVQAGIDSIPFVYRKNGVRQIVVPGESNEKNIIIEKGLEAGSSVYLVNPGNPEKFKLKGEELVPVLRERMKKSENHLADKFQP